MNTLTTTQLYLYHNIEDGIIVSKNDILKYSFSYKQNEISKLNQDLDVLLKNELIINIEDTNLFCTTELLNNFPTEYFSCKLESTDYITEYKALHRWNLLVDNVTMSTIKNKDNISYSTKYYSIGSISTYNFSKEDLKKYNLTEYITESYKSKLGNSIILKYATKERAFFDFLVTHYSEILKDNTLEQFGDQGYRFEILEDVNTEDILTYCTLSNSSEIYQAGELLVEYIKSFRGKV